MIALATPNLFDTEGFMKQPAPPYPRSREAQAVGCTCYPSPQREEARRVGLPWYFERRDCPVHGSKE